MTSLRRLMFVLSISRYLCAQVSDITGIAIPALFERQSTGRMSTIQRQCLYDFNKSRDHGYYAELNRDYASDDIAGHLRLAALYTYDKTGFKCNPVRITKYDWVSPALLHQCLSVLKKHIPEDTKSVRYEVGIARTWRFREDLTMTVLGTMDIVTDDTVFEIKCKSQLQDEDRMQLALYAWLVHNNQFWPFNYINKFRLLNIRTGEMEELLSTEQELEEFVTIIINDNLKGELKLKDAEFFKACGDVVQTIDDKARKTLRKLSLAISRGTSSKVQKSEGLTENRLPQNKSTSKLKKVAAILVSSESLNLTSH